MYSQMFSGPVTETQTTQSYKPGELVVTNDKTYGTRIWRYIKNTDTVATVVGSLIQRKALGTDNMSGILCVTAKANRFVLLGVAQSAIPASSFGFILKSGIGSVFAKGTLTAADYVMATTTAGQGATANVTVIADTLGVYATALTTATDAVVTAMVDVP